MEILKKDPETKMVVVGGGFAGEREATEAEKSRLVKNGLLDHSFITLPPDPPAEAPVAPAAEIQHPQEQ